MRQSAIALLLAASLGMCPLSSATAGEPPPQAEPSDVSKVYPSLIGAAVGPQNHAYWPVRVQGLEKINWVFNEGRHVGMAVPIGDDLLAVQAGGGGIRGVRASTGKSVWYSAGETRFWNYSTCIAGPKGVTYGGNYDWIQAVDPDGERLWRTDLRARWIHAPPALSPDGKTVYVAGDGVGLAALSAETGLVEWLRRDFASPWSTYCFDRSGRLIVTTRSDTTCYARNGAQLWNLGKPLAHLMLVGEVLLGTRGKVLLALDAGSQKPLWSWKGSADISGLAFGDDGRIAISQVDGHAASLDIRGKQRWRRRISQEPLQAPVATLGGETLVIDGKGALSLLGRGGRTLASIETGAAPFRWRPTVGPDGRVYVAHAQRIVCVGGAPRPQAKPLTANELTIVADDFVVDIWVNGKRLALDSREMIGERFGAMSERVFVDLDEGDWIVFNVVANRLRWGGASYFGVHARGPEGEMAFVSSRKGGWSACDEPAEVKAFIGQRAAGIDQPALAPSRPWQNAPQIWKDLLGQPFTGDPVWGREPLTWIKYVVGAPDERPPSAPSPAPGTVPGC